MTWRFISPTPLLAIVIALATVPAAAADPPGGARLLAKLPGPAGTAAAFSRDGKLVLTAGGNQAWVWDSETYKPVTGPLKHGSAIHSAAFSPDGTRLVTAADDGTARAWDARISKVLLSLDHGQGLLSADFGSDGSRLLTVGGRTVRIWDAATGAHLLDLPHKFPVRFAALSPDGSRVFALANPIDPKKRFQTVEYENNTGHLWDAGTGKLLARLTADPSIEETRSPAAFSADGKKLIAAGWGHADVWDAATGRRLRRLQPIDYGAHPTTPISVALNADGSKAVTTTAPGQLQVWDTATGKRRDSMFLDGAAWIRLAHFAPDGRRLVLAAQYDVSGVWDLDRHERLVGVEAWEPSGSQDFPAVALSPDGKRFAAGFASDGFTSVWEVPGPKQP